jgi:hypothetical protein
MSLGIALGGALGITLGVLAGRIALWLNAGMAIGIAIGSNLRRKSHECNECAAAHRHHKTKVLNEGTDN